MKVKLLKKVRKEYKIIYREEPYEIIYGHSIIKGNYKVNKLSSYVFKNKQDAIIGIINRLRDKYSELGNYNRQRKIKEQEHKVWYNE